MKFKDIHWTLRLVIGIGIGYFGGYLILAFLSRMNS